jgi:predicted protein tyrosine phosphatase|tara:strand:+ start:470 stop:976 length:507 start_codon:yes stop_codon:yes gene_type:complete
MMRKIIICGLADIENAVETYKPDMMLTIINKNFSPETPQGLNPSRHLKMLIDDISEPRDGFRLPEKEDVQKLLDFTSDWDQSKPIIIHCHMGISRSTATSLGLICKLDPDNLDLHVEKLMKIAPHASPNKLMTKYVDEILGLENKLLKTLDFFDPEPIEESRIVEFDF